MPGMSAIHLHKHHERLMIAKVQGIASRHASAAVVNDDAAIAEIRDITEDPHLLGHAWLWEPRYPVFEDPRRDAKNRLLGLAGADPQRPNSEPLC